MKKYTVSFTQIICGALVAVFAVILAFGERKYFWLLAPLGMGIYMPFYAWWTTGRFTYLPTVVDTKAPLSIKELGEFKTQGEIKEKPKKNQNIYYDLGDIPFPPRRTIPKPTVSLPYGSGYAPKKIAAQRGKENCVLVSLVSQHQEATDGGKQNAPLNDKIAVQVDPALEEVTVAHDGIFL